MNREVAGHIDPEKMRLFNTQLVDNEGKHSVHENVDLFIVSESLLLAVPDIRRRGGWGGGRQRTANPVFGWMIGFGIEGHDVTIYPELVVVLMSGDNSTYPDYPESVQIGEGGLIFGRKMSCFQASTRSFGDLFEYTVDGSAIQLTDEGTRKLEGHLEKLKERPFGCFYGTSWGF